MWTWFSDPFGTDAANSNPAGIGSFAYNLRFPGQIFHGPAGLHQNYFRDFDPATGRYIESDPIGLFGGINTYAYVGASPLQHADLTGLATAVFYSRGIDGNPFGHLAVATTGAGIYSFGTPDPYGGSVKDYLARQLSERPVEVVILPNTTPEQEALIRASMIKNHKKDYGVITNNCAQAVSNALTDADVLPATEYGPPSLPGLNFLNIFSLPGATYQLLPKGSAPPASFLLYNPEQPK
jgi:RHS repeat-associated protein